MKLQCPEASSLLQSVFKFLDSAEIEYCVERNYEGYPDRLTGDVDLVVGDADLIRAASGIIGVAAKVGWKCYQHHVWGKTAYIGLASDVFPNRFALTIELFAGARWHGLPFLDAMAILRERSRHGVTWKPRPAHQVIITSIHHLLYNNHVPKKYRARISELVKTDANEVEIGLSKAFGKSLAAKIKDELLASRWIAFDSKFSRRLKYALLFRALITNPIVFFRITSMGLLANSRRPAGVILYVNSPNRLYSKRLCSSLLYICDKWHIFAPPLRYIIDDQVPAGKDLNLLKKTTISGGVAIIATRVLMEKAVAAVSSPIYEIESEQNRILVRCSEKQIANYEELNSKSSSTIEQQAYQILNDILAHRADSYRPNLDE